MTELHLDIDGVTNGYVSIRVVDPLGGVHDIEDYGVDGLVFEGTAESNAPTSALTWEELSTGGYDVVADDGSEVSVGDVKTACDGHLA